MEGEEIRETFFLCSLAAELRRHVHDSIGIYLAEKSGHCSYNFSGADLEGVT